jgi:hypothetical protein
VTESDRTTLLQELITRCIGRYYAR